MSRIRFAPALLLVVIAAAVATPEEAAKPPVELGAVAWERDFDRALEAARSTKKPVLLLFQEVPG